MKTIYKKQSHPLIPSYRENGALQLIIASGSAFIMFHFIRVIMITMHVGKEEIFSMMFPNFGLSTIRLFQTKFWTILTYGWLHHGFFDWVTNMIWLYCFGSILQSVAGYKQVIPLFVYALLVGGGFFLTSQLLSETMLSPANNYFMGSQAGVLALGIAALTLVPRYRLHLTPNFSIPLVIIVGIYVLLDIMVFLPDQLNVLALCLGGLLTGFIYATLLKRGSRPGEWVYDMLDRAAAIVTPNEGISMKRSKKRMEVLRTMYEPKKGISQHRIDDILDKINEHGYHSLTREEKDILLNASKD
jgi:membrane associated rhomboid family serine protease